MLAQMHVSGTHHTITFVNEARIAIGWPSSHPNTGNAA